MIELAVFSGLTHPEIASQTRLPLETIKARTRNGMNPLGEKLSFLVGKQESWPLMESLLRICFGIVGGRGFMERKR